ncbi:MAG: metallophosphoesterase family protein [Anaerolineales bacterium]|nr:metallophosphoesterase family protein [Anaerolineales bacterium]MCZ2121307.1 metallophosphatase family protein [Anaerolineales bacterium]
MRIAFISDIHGNFTALEAVLADIKLQNVDRVICLGDVVTLGPQPREVLEAIQALDCVCIKGNHDWATLNPEDAVRYEIAAHLIPDLIWCREQLSEAHLDFIRAFLPTYEFQLPNGSAVLCFHGSPLAPTDLIQATTPKEEIENLLKGQTAAVFIGGHSHIQMHRRLGAKLILNSGSVGNAFEYAFTPGIVPGLLPWAEYAILEQVDNALNINLRRVPYDTEKLKAEVRKSSLPGAAWWLRQFPEK